MVLLIYLSQQFSSLVSVLFYDFPHFFRSVFPSPEFRGDIAPSRIPNYSFLKSRVNEADKLASKGGFAINLPYSPEEIAFLVLNSCLKLLDELEFEFRSDYLVILEFFTL